MPTLIAPLPTFAPNCPAIARVSLKPDFRIVVRVARVLGRKGRYCLQSHGVGKQSPNSHLISYNTPFPYLDRGIIVAPIMSDVVLIREADIT
jgi:hypothetical protein